MKQINKKYLLAGGFLLASAAKLFAQTQVTVDTEQVESWMETNWIWLAAGALVLILIIAFAASGNKSRRKSITTTVIKDELGNVKKVHTTEVRE